MYYMRVCVCVYVCACARACACAYVCVQPHKCPPLLSNLPMMLYHPQRFPSNSQISIILPSVKPVISKDLSHTRSNHSMLWICPINSHNFLFHAESNHMITSQSDQRFVFQGRPPLNNEMSEKYQPQSTNQMHHGGQQMQFDNQMRPSIKHYLSA